MKAILNAWEMSIIDPLVRAAKPSVYVELGGAFGGSLRWFAERTIAGATLVTIDVPELIDPDNAGPLKETVSDLLRQGYNAHWIRKRTENPETMEELGSILGGRKADILFIDAGHLPWQVGPDFHNYTPYLKEGGLLIMHDVGPVIQRLDRPRMQAAQISCNAVFKFASVNRQSLLVQGIGNVPCGTGVIWW